MFALLAGMVTSTGASGLLLGIPLALVLLSWFFKYAYVLFDHVVRGFDEPPALDLSMMNPVDEQRPLAQLVILVLVAAGVGGVMIVLPWAGWVLAGLALLILPACVAILGLEGNPLQAVNPWALARMIHGMGFRYVQVLAFMALVAVALAVLVRLNLWGVLQFALGQFAVLSVFSALGGALYERRHELGLETWASPERTEEKLRQAELAANEAAVTAAYGLARAGEHVKAWGALETWLAGRGREPEDYRWLIDRVTVWPEARYGHRLNEQYVTRLLELNRSGAALDAVAARLSIDAAFRPATAAATLRIAELAARGGGAPGVARRLLSDFATRFPGDPAVERAATLARHLGD